MSHWTRRNNLWLLLIIAVALLLRFYRLGHESCWLDELYDMVEADPAYPMSKLFDALKTFDSHPPLFYLCERCIFIVFGESEATARILPALAGTGAVWVMFLLGKEALNERLGLVASSLTCVNYFAIWYSREVRGYSFLFFFSALSLVFLFRLIKNLRTRDMWGFGIAALGILYSHYFGVFLVFAEYCAAGVLFFSDNDRKLFAMRFGGSMLIILAGYSFWMPVLFSLVHIHSSWIKLDPGWFADYFKSYFGGSPVVYLMLALWVVYIAGVFIKRYWRWPGTKVSPPALSFVLLMTTIVVTLIVPFVRSLFSVPTLVDRYTIVVLPSLLVAIAYGIELLPWKRVKYIVIAGILLLCLERNILEVQIYTKPHKSQFREVTAYMAADTAADHFPVLNDRVAFQEAYYIRKFKYPGQLWDMPRTAVIDSLVRKASPRFAVAGFWLMNAHQAGLPNTFLDSVTRAKLDSSFVITREGRFVDAWAQLYMRKP
ncbi:MAG TPA: glycosyltransferase family 39 protein [Puia sp.]|nr:glycosyltransferase family 39 protein [Puia sp.]